MSTETQCQHDWETYHSERGLSGLRTCKICGTKASPRDTEPCVHDFEPIEIVLDWFILEDHVGTTKPMNAMMCRKCEYIEMDEKLTGM